MDVFADTRNENATYNTAKFGLLRLALAQFRLHLLFVNVMLLLREARNFSGPKSPCEHRREEDIDHGGNAPYH